MSSLFHSSEQGGVCMQEEINSFQPHNLILEDRKKLKISGVTDVDSFDENTIIAYTQEGELTIGGTKLHINKLNTEDGELTVEGNIVSLIYVDQTPKSTGFFGKMFR